MQDPCSDYAQFKGKVGVVVLGLRLCARSREVKVGRGLDWHFIWIFEGLRVLSVEALNFIFKYWNGGKIHPGLLCLELADIIIKTN